MVALRDACFVALRDGDRKLDLHLATGAHASELEADRLEDAEHLPVVGHHLGEEPLDALGGCPSRKLLEQTGPDAATLERVGDGECDFGQRRIAQADVVGESHHVLSGVVPDRGQQRSVLFPIGIQDALEDTVVDVPNPVETEVQAALREPSKEREQRLDVLALRRTQAKSGAVPQDDVDGFLRIRDLRHQRSTTRNASITRAEPATATATTGFRVVSVASGRRSASTSHIIAPAAKPRPSGRNAANSSTNRKAGTAMSGWGRLEKMLHAAALRTEAPRETRTRLIARPSGML